MKMVNHFSFFTVVCMQLEDKKLVRESLRYRLLIGKQVVGLDRLEHNEYHKKCMLMDCMVCKLVWEHR